MNRNRASYCYAILIFVSFVALKPPTVRADDIGPLLLRGFREFGFGVTLTDRSGTLPGGISASADAAFNNTKFDLGMASLTLNGPMSFQFNASNRLGPAAEFRVTTANQPLNYNLDINTGAQDFTAVGAAQIEASSKINIFGFYDMNMTVSNRGTFTSNGFLLDDSGTLAYDVGPIDVSGNIFVDALSLLTEPFFAGTGLQNPFSKFSGRATREQDLSKTVDALKGKVESGNVLDDQDMADLVDATVLAAVFGLDMPDLSFLNEAQIDATFLEGTDPTTLVNSGQNGILFSPTIVPEPASAVMLIGGALLVLRRRRSI